MNPSISTLRMLFGGLIFGLVSFASIMLWLSLNRPSTPNPDAALYWAILGGLAVSELAAYFFLRAAIVGNAQRQFQAGGSVSPRESAWPGLYFTATVIGAALAEGVGLFASVLLLLLGDARLLIFVGAALAAKTALFPTENRYRTFVQRITGSWPTSG